MDCRPRFDRCWPEYRSVFSVTGSLEERIKNDPILAMRGLGKEIWADIDADEYVRQLREDWE